MKRTHLQLLVTTIAFLIALPFIASAGDPGPYFPPPTAAPIDGGLSLLIAAGIGYASKKAYDKRKKDKLKRDISE